MNLEPLQKKSTKLLILNSMGRPYDFWGLAVVQMDGRWMDGYVITPNLSDA